MLLDDQPPRDTYYQDLLKACVIAASVSHEQYQQTVSVAAMQLIMHKKIDEAVQLLSLIGKSSEACRYLQQQDRWIDAALLARLSMNESESADVFRRWSIHLEQRNQLVRRLM